MPDTIDLLGKVKSNHSHARLKCAGAMLCMKIIEILTRTSSKRVRNWPLRSCLYVPPFNLGRKKAGTLTHPMIPPKL